MSRKRILVVLLVAALAVTFIMLLWAWTGGTGGSPAGPATPSTTAPLPTAEEALGPAQEAARRWQADAWLASVSATWSRASRESLLAGPAGWSFVFYSPTAGEIRYIGVGPEGASPGRRFPAPTPPERVEEWRLLATDALLAFLASGGERYLQEHPTAAVNLRLEAESGRVVWTILAVEGGAEPFTLRLDARTGERLP